MKHETHTPRSAPSTRKHLSQGLPTFVLVLGWYCLAALAQADGATPRDALDTYSVPQGIAMPCQRATMSAPLQGILVDVRVKAGDPVQKGTILAVMDNRVATSCVSAARAAAERTADIEHSKHALELARSLFARHSSLQDSRAGSEFELEQAKAQCGQAEATLASAMEVQLQARRNLELEETRLESHNIRAPFDGDVVHIEPTVGTTLTPSDELLTLVNLDTLEAELYLPLELFGAMQTGTSYQLNALAPVDRPIDAHLAFASPMIDPASKTFRCVFLIENQDRRLPAGFGVRFDPATPDSHTQETP